MLTDLGWTKAFERQFRPLEKLGLVPGLIVQDNKISYTVYSELAGFQDAILTGRLWHEAESDAELPAVGDWVALEPPGPGDVEAIIRERMPRRSCFSRKAPGKGTEQQVIAANIDSVILVTEPRADINTRRVERFLMLANRSGALPVVVINKADLLSAEDRRIAMEVIGEVAPNVPVHMLSALTNEGFQELQRYLGKGKVVALIGSSGVGKSTLINALTDTDDQWTGDVNELTGKGRHTTTWRSVIFLPSGGLIIDNPGIRELQMWTDERSLRESFSDIEEIANQCQFHDCKHGDDRGCSVRAALEAGELDPERFRNYLSLDDEIAKLKTRQKKRAMTLARIAKREKRHRHRNYEDRMDHRDSFEAPRS